MNVKKKKIPSCFLQEEEQRNLAWPQEKLDLLGVYKNLNDLGEAEYSTPASSSYQFPPNGDVCMGSEWEALIRSQFRSIDSLKDWFLTVGLENTSPYPTLTTTLISPVYYGSFYSLDHAHFSRKKLRGIPKDKTYSLKRLNKYHQMWEESWNYQARNFFPLRLRKTQGCPFLPLFFNIILEALANAVKLEKEISGL